jgi:two-component system phosphate regulon response regulator PhoB
MIGRGKNMSSKRILVVEDDEDIMELISHNLERENYSVTRAGSGEEAVRQVAAKPPEAILLDLMLPEMDGLEVCRRLKADRNWRHIPIVMVSAKGEESDVIAGLELGADDYITKPFRVKELVARVRAVLRRKASPPPGETDAINLPDLQIDPRRHAVLVKGKSVDLTHTEFQVLLALARHPGWVLTRYQIVDEVRGADYPVTDRSVDVQIVGLRKKLGKTGLQRETVHGVGYRFKDPEQ